MGAGGVRAAHVPFDDTGAIGPYLSGTRRRPSDADQLARFLTPVTTACKSLPALHAHYRPPKPHRRARTFSLPWTAPPSARLVASRPRPPPFHAPPPACALTPKDTKHPRARPSACSSRSRARYASISISAIPDKDAAARPAPGRRGAGSPPRQSISSWPPAKASSELRARCPCQFWTPRPPPAGRRGRLAASTASAPASVFCLGSPRTRERKTAGRTAWRRSCKLNGCARPAGRARPVAWLPRVPVAAGRGQGRELEQHALLHAILGAGKIQEATRTKKQAVSSEEAEREEDWSGGRLSRRDMAC